MGATMLPHVVHYPPCALYINAYTQDFRCRHLHTHLRSHGGFILSDVRSSLIRLADVMYGHLATQLAKNHSALCFHDRGRAHTVYVWGAYVTQYSGRGWAYYFFFSPLFVLWPERNGGIDVFTASRPPCPRSCAQIYRLRILGRPPLWWRVACQGTVSVCGNTQGLFKLYKALVNERSIKEGP